MKRSTQHVALFVVACALQPAITCAQVHVRTAGDLTSSASWFHAAPVQAKILEGSDGSTYVGVWIDTPAQTGTVVRAPLDVALVIDTSGSMSGEKINNARAAATSFIESLADGDMVSLFAFSDDVHPLSGPTLVGPGTRSMLTSAVNGLQAMGGTNMYAGLTAGEAAVAAAPAGYPVRRVVVISDGRANIGPSSSEALSAVAAQGTEHGAQVTTIGVGSDYDESLLGALAVHSSGRMYHLDTPSQMSAILHDELSLLGQTVASNAMLEFDAPPGVTVESTDNLRVDHVGSTLRIPLGSLYGAQHREVLLHAHVNTSAAGARELGTARLRWQDPMGAHTAHSTEIPLYCEVTADASEPARSVDGRVQAMVASNTAAQSQQHAAQLLNRGQFAQATEELDRAQTELHHAAAYHFSDDGVRAQLLRQSAGVSRGQAAATAAAARPSMARDAALQNNAAAMHAYGY